jgi:hypothetical protein
MEREGRVRDHKRGGEGGEEQGKGAGTFEKGGS